MTIDGKIYDVNTSCKKSTDNIYYVNLLFVGAERFGGISPPYLSMLGRGSKKTGVAIPPTFTLKKSNLGVYFKKGRQGVKCN